MTFVCTKLNLNSKYCSIAIVGSWKEFFVKVLNNFFILLPIENNFICTHLNHHFHDKSGLNWFRRFDWNVEFTPPSKLLVRWAKNKINKICSITSDVYEIQILFLLTLILIQSYWEKSVDNHVHVGNFMSLSHRFQRRFLKQFLHRIHMYVL